MNHKDTLKESWFEASVAELNRLLAGRGMGVTVEYIRRDWIGRMPSGYREATAPADAAWDWSMGLSLREPGGVGLAGPGRLRITPAGQEETRAFRLRRAGSERMELSTWLPVLESFGLVMVEAVPWYLAPVRGRAGLFVDDIGIRFSDELAAVSSHRQALMLSGASADRLIEAIVASFAGRAEVTPLNRLVLNTALGWWEVNLLSAYCRYRAQAGGSRAVEKAQAIARALVGFPNVAAAAVALFKARLLPEGSTEAETLACQDMEQALAGVSDLEHDEAMHELLAMIEATTRSNWALGTGVVALKFSSSGVPFLPSPRPFAEIYTWSTWFEGLHLRFGPVARGGIRWSDRTSDLRSEVLGLAMAQVKKNSLIVPTGAKGAFCLRPGAPVTELRLPSITPDALGRAAYEAFVGALLELTDNTVEGHVVHPPLVCLDGEDPYLVVAADKGTAHFSDLANSISIRKGFWLKDAFASGGSNGYDHKALGITSRGAWLAVRRHFRALGLDPDEDELRVAGVGDMSGDVFGNTMLQSRRLRLVAAFDHRHVFLDPNPDPVVSYAERERLCFLSGSSWADFDLRKASRGAAVYGRQSKKVTLSVEAGSALGVGAVTLSPPQLVRAVLTAPVDLLFFGGIGTFVRGPAEFDIEIEDASNDAVRIDAKDLRARVITEGANLALTQKARAAYSRRGGRLNADFVDNAAGVALSDLEVNMKVLLALAEAGGGLDARQCRQLLVEAEEEAALSVLGRVDGGIVALDRSAAASPEALAAYQVLMRDLEADGLLDREVEALPSDEDLAQRAEAGAGFSRPELAVLVAYARRELAHQVELSDLAAAGELDALVVGYFPAAVRSACREYVERHPLRRQLAASELANEVLEHMGPVWAHEASAESGRSLHEVAAAFWVARQVLRADSLMAVLTAEAAQWSPEAEEAVRASLTLALDRAARWYLCNPARLTVAEQVRADRVVVERTPSLLRAEEALQVEFQDLGVPAHVARETVRLVASSGLSEVAAVCRASGRSALDAVEAMEEAADLLCARALGRQLGKAHSADLWDRRQLHLLADDLARYVVATAAGALSAFPGRDGRAAVGEFLALRVAAVDYFTSLARSADLPGRVSISLLSVTVRALGEIASEYPVNPTLR